MESKKIIAIIAGGVVLAGGTWLIIQAIKKRRQSNIVLPSDNSIIPSDGSSLINKILAPKPTDSFPLNIGSKGDNVKYLQNALNTLGASLQVDEILGNQTYTAVVTFAGSKYWTPQGVTLNGFNEILTKANSI